MCKIAWSCILACLTSVIGDVLFLAAVGMYIRESNVQDFDRWTELHPDLIQKEWNVRRDQRPLETAAGLFNAASWIILVIPLWQVAYQLSLGGRHLVGLHLAIAVLALSGALAEFIAGLMFTGAFVTMDWLATDFNLAYWTAIEARGDEPDDIGWRSLEVAYMSISGLVLFANAIEWLFLGVILFLLFLSIQRQQVLMHPADDDGTSPSSSGSSGGAATFYLNMAFGGYSLVLSLICLIDFSFEILRFKSWTTFSGLAFIVGVFSRLLLWPIWYLWLGRQVARPLPAAASTMTQELITMRRSGSGDDDDDGPEEFVGSATTTTAAGAPLSEKDDVLT